MAVRYPDGFDLSVKQWEQLVAQQQQAELFKKLNDNAELRVWANGNLATYTYWLDGTVRSLAQVRNRHIDEKLFADVLFVAVDPTQKRQGFGSTLLWELYLSLNEPLLLGGAVSTGGEALLRSLVSHFQQRQGFTPDMINIVDGSTSALDVDALFKKPYLSLMLEGARLDAARASLADGSMLWLHRPNLFEGQP